MKKHFRTKQSSLLKENKRKEDKISFDSSLSKEKKREIKKKKRIDE